MDDDKIPLSPNNRTPRVVAVTREKFDSLLDQALSKKGRSRSKRRIKKDEKIRREIQSPIGGIGIDELPKPAPRLSIISSIKTTKPTTEEKDATSDFENRTSRHGSAASRKESTIIMIDDEAETDTTTSQTEPSFSTRRQMQLQTLSPITSTKSIKDRHESIKKKERKQKSEESHFIEMKTLHPKVPKSPSHKSEIILEYLSITLHGCQLPSNAAPHCISIRVHVIDIDAGRELYITEQTPVISQTSEKSFDIKGKFATIEKVIFFQSSLQLALENNVIVFFELLIPEKQSLNTFPCYTRLDNAEKCIGWSFLKLKGINNHNNCKEKVRLQIYEPLVSFKHKQSQDFKLVHGWWCRGPWRKTFCSLYVTVGGAPFPNDNSPINSSKNKLTTNNTEENECNNSPALESLLSDVTPDWVRSPGQLCKVTSLVHMSLPMKTANCLSLVFSQSGSFLACAASNNNIYIYQLPAFKEHCTLVGHQGLIYSVSWLSDSLLISASADCTVVVWDVKKHQLTTILPHPTFVYCCQFIPNEEGKQIVTGSKDQIVRIWRQGQENEDFDLWQELEGHEGFITSLCFTIHDQLFSADSEGSILMWSKNEQHDWQLEKELVVSGVKGISVNCIIPHSAGSRLLVHARDSLLRLVDIGTSAVVQNYVGALSHKVQTGASISPCGSLVMAGGEEGSISCWQTETGSLLSHSDPLTNYSPPVTSLAYHPSAHLMVTGYFGHPAMPVKVWIHDADHVKDDEQLCNSQLDLPGKNLTKSSSPQVDKLHLHDIIARIDQVLTSSPT